MTINEIIARILASFGNTSAKAQVAVYTVERASARVDARRVALLNEEKMALSTTQTTATSLRVLATGITTDESTADASRAAELTAFDDRTGAKIKALQERLRQLEIRRAAARTKLTSSQEADRTAAKRELAAITRALGAISTEMANLVEQQDADEAIADSFGLDVE